MRLGVTPVGFLGSASSRAPRLQRYSLRPARRALSPNAGASPHPHRSGGSSRTRKTPYHWCAWSCNWESHLWASWGLPHQEHLDCGGTHRDRSPRRALSPNAGVSPHPTEAADRVEPGRLHTTGVPGPAIGNHTCGLLGVLETGCNVLKPSRVQQSACRRRRMTGCAPDAAIERLSPHLRRGARCSMNGLRFGCSLRSCVSWRSLSHVYVLSQSR